MAGEKLLYGCARSSKGHDGDKRNKSGENYCVSIGMFHGVDFTKARLTGQPLAAEGGNEK